jgi:hypothetical protein
MNYNPEDIKGKRPRGGEIWIDSDLTPIRILSRHTTSTLMGLGRRSRLSECEDLVSMVTWCTPDGKMGGFSYEQEFVGEYAFFGTAKALKISLP